MSEAEILKEIRNDLNFLKEKVISMEITINEFESDIHKEPNPEYIKTLDKIEIENIRIHFRNIEEFDKHFGL